MKTAYCFDLDGTITTEEILPLIAKELDLYEEINTLTEITMNGYLTFEKSFKLRVKLLSSIDISYVKNIIKKVHLGKNIVKFLKDNKDNSFIITGNLDVWIKDLVKSIGCNLYCSLAEYSEEKISGIKKILNKSEAIDEIRKKYDKIISIGDGMNDVSMFEKSDLSIAYGGVHSPVETLIKLSNYVVYNEVSLCNLLKML